MSEENLFLGEVSIHNSSENQYQYNSGERVDNFIRNSNGELVGERGTIKYSRNKLLCNFIYGDVDVVFHYSLANKIPYKNLIIPLQIDIRLLGRWKGYLSGGYGGSSTSEKFLLIKDNGTYSEKSNSTSGGYDGGYSSHVDDEKGNYQIINQTVSGGKIKFFGRELEYILSDNDKKLFLYGVNYYRQY